MTWKQCPSLSPPDSHGKSWRCLYEESHEAHHGTIDLMWTDEEEIGQESD
jgi:hypothetical protein